MSDTFYHPGFGVYYDSDDIGSDAGINPRQGCNLKVGVVCKECNEQFLMFNTPDKCSKHEGEEAL